jgi:hypothetical protein
VPQTVRFRRRIWERRTWHPPARTRRPSDPQRSGPSLGLSIQIHADPRPPDLPLVSISVPRWLGEGRVSWLHCGPLRETIIHGSSQASPRSSRMR